MVKRIATIILLPVIAMAQTQSTGKKGPESRKVEVENKPMASQAAKPLPKIDLPEFVITGTASIDLPDVKKIVLEEVAADRTRTSIDPGKRDRETVEFSGGSAGQRNESEIHLLRGKATASIGSFFSPNISLWLGRTDADIEYSGGLDYFRTTGFAPHTDRSGGKLSVNGGMNMRSSLSELDKARVQGSAQYRAVGYKFYGSANPAASRNINSLSLSASMMSPNHLPWSYETALSVQSASVADSSSLTSEFQIDLGLTTLYPTPPIRFDLRTSLASLGGSASASLTFVELGLGLDRIQWKDWFLTACARVFGAGGMNDQSLSRMYPNVNLEYGVSREQTLGLYYNPRVEFWNLSRHTDRNPYLSAASVIRHTDVYQAGGIAWQGNWSEMLKTKMSVEVSAQRDYPLYADSASLGRWTLAYGGTTKLFKYKAELFAKFSANDYFGSALVMNSSRNTLTGRAIPYLPDVELSAAYTHDFDSGVSVTGDMAFFRGQLDNVVNASTLKGAFVLNARGEYRMLTWLRTFLELRNITNEQYELWKGYKAFPFTMAVGLTAVW